MKKLLALLMLSLSPILSASEFPQQLRIEENIVTHSLLEYEKSYENDVYNFYIRNDVRKIGPKQFLVHTMVEYKIVDGIEYAALGYTVKRIFNYGMLDCEQRAFSVTSDIYVDTINKIVYREDYELGEFVSELMTPNTARNSVYKKVCFNYL